MGNLAWIFGFKGIYNQSDIRKLSQNSKMAILGITIFWNIESQLYWSKLWERIRLTSSHLSLGFDRNFNWILISKYISLQKQNLEEAPYTGLFSLFSCLIIQHNRELVPNSISFLIGSNLCFQNWAVMVWHVFVLQSIPVCNGGYFVMLISSLSMMKPVIFNYIVSAGGEKITDFTRNCLLFFSISDHTIIRMADNERMS